MQLLFDKTINQLVYKLYITHWGETKHRIYYEYVLYLFAQSTFSTLSINSYILHKLEMSNQHSCFIWSRFQLYFITARAVLRS